LSFIPEFELGLWNAWILTLPFLLLWLSFLFLNRERKEDPAVWKRVDKRMRKSNITGQLTFFGALIYSVFLPLKLETTLLWIGLFIYMIGIIFVTMAVLAFAATPKDRPVTKGIYRISRNPMYLGMFMLFIGVGIACVSWVFLISAVVVILFMRKVVVFEEAICIGKYGNAYVEYRNRTPWWIGIPKSQEKE
jgi:protein-S-isoprenylcysteine O-methyltransferase Ste14